jgi:hypothetical protein
MNSLLTIDIQDQQLSYEFTREDALLKQYFEIREKVYVETFNLADFSTHYDNYDYHTNTDVLVVKCNEKVIGGSRLTFHYQNNDLRLPMEDEDFLLEEILPDFNLKKKIYAEITRMAVLPEYRKGREVGDLIIGLQVSQAIYKGAEHLFTVAPAIQSRNNRRRFNHLGYPTEIRQDINVPDKPAYEGRSMYLSITEIKNQMPAISQELAKEFSIVT